MAKTPATVDFGDTFAVNDEPVPVTLVKGIFGEEFHVKHDVNLFQMMAMADESPKLSDMHRMMVSLIQDDEQPRFKSVVGRQQHLKAEQIGELFNRLLAVASEERPTTSSNASSRTTRVKAVGRGSAAS